MTVTLTAIFASGQSSISGRITDANGLLAGATVKDSLSGKTAVTDLNGTFYLQGLKTGRSVLSVNYVGYKTFVKQVILDSGTNEVPTILLSNVVSQLSEIIVRSAVASSQMKALNIKKNAPGIMEVLAADAIGKLPDRNAAEAVQRLQGVSVARYHGEADQATVRGTPFAWTSTLFNGTRMPSASVYGTRNSILDAVPSEMIQYVQLSKAITPDMEGDAIGGSIDFIMRTAPAKRTFNISAAGGYNWRSQNGTYNASLVYGDRFFKNKLGVIVASSIWDRNWATDELALAYNTNLTGAARNSINSMNAKRYFGKRRTYGINAGLEYVFNPNHKVYARVLSDKFDDIRPVYESYYEFNSNRYRFSYRYSFYETAINGLEIGGSHRISEKTKLEWRGSEYTMAFTLNTPPNYNEKGLPIAQFYQRLSGKFGNLSADGRKYLRFDSPDGIGDDPLNIQPALTNATADVLDPSKLLLQQLILYKLNQKEKDKVFQLDFTTQLSDKFTLKYGGKLRSKNRFGEATPMVFIPSAALGVPNSPALVKLSEMKTAAYPLPANFFSELGRPFNNLISTPITKQQLYDIFTSSFFTSKGIRDVSPLTNATTQQSGDENAVAGYLMGTYKPHAKWTIIGGMRSEYTDITMKGKKVNAATKTVSDLLTTSDYFAWLPMLHAKYSVSDNSNIRFAYTKTFVRANFTDLNPSTTEDLSGAIPRLSRGNANLKPTFSNNWDLMAEHYFSNIGLVSGGFFHKKITNIIFTNTANESINGVNYLVTQPQNLENSNLTGFEMGITRRFSRLPGFLGGFGLEANYTHVVSSVEVPRITSSGVVMDKTSLPNQSKNMWNLIVFYEKYGVSLRLAGNFRGKSVETIQQQLGNDFYIWSDNNFTLDFSASWSITPKLKTFVELNNLTNSYIGLYMGNNKDRITSREWYSMRGQAGIKLDIF